MQKWDWNPKFNLFSKFDSLELEHLSQDLSPTLTMKFVPVPLWSKYRTEIGDWWVNTIFPPFRSEPRVSPDNYDSPGHILLVWLFLLGAKYRLKQKEMSKNNLPFLEGEGKKALTTAGLPES